MVLRKEEKLKAPFPYRGGKSKIAGFVWEKFGDVPRYIEPFAGSSAVLLGRPDRHRRKYEAINDSCGFVTNLWRTIKNDPEFILEFMARPVSSIDFWAMHDEILRAKDVLKDQLVSDFNFYDRDVAAMWLHCGCIYTFSSMGNSLIRGQPGISGDNYGRGFVAWQRGGKSKKRLMSLAMRFLRVFIFCGDWSLMAKENIIHAKPRCRRISGIFLDPPYKGYEDVYGDISSVSSGVMSWCSSAGNDPRKRIVLCGFDREYDDLISLGWVKFSWHRGSGRTSTDATAESERIWCSPACL